MPTNFYRTGVIRLINNYGEVVRQLRYKTKNHKAKIINAWSRIENKFIHVIPDLNRKDVPVDAPQRGRPKKKIKKKKTDPELQSKYVQKVFHLPKRNTMRDRF